MVFLFRDVRDVVISMQTLRTPSGATWLEDYGAPTLRFFANSAGFRQRYARELAQLERWHDPPHAVAALYWRFKSDSYFDYLEAGLPILPLRYEELVTDPRTKLGTVTGFLGLPWRRRCSSTTGATTISSTRAAGRWETPIPTGASIARRWAAIDTSSPRRSCSRSTRSAGDTMRRIDEIGG